MINYLSKNANKFFKFLNKCLKIVNKKAYILSSKNIFRLYKTGCAYLNLTPSENKVKTTFISDLTSSTLPFAKGFIQRKSSPKKEYSEISVSRFLLDCGSDSSILSFKDYKRFKLNMTN